jgi:2-dehydropantoate 2-reductase
MADRTSRIIVAGAGSIGCYVGGCLALAGRNVTLLLRPTLAQAIAQHGLRISDLDGADRALPPTALALALATDPSQALARAQIVLVTVKSGATAEMADLIARHAPAEASLVPGMVPFNVVQTRNGSQRPRFHRATSGTMLIAPGVPGLRDALDVPGAALTEHPDMTGVLWGKLILNLNNALNALAGVPLAVELADRRWRVLFAAQIEEALVVLKAAHIRPAGVEGVPPRVIPLILRLPDWLFRLVARRMLAIDPAARSSMWEDLLRGRATEIDYLQGAILALADRTGVAAPMTQRIIRLIKEAESARAGSPALQPAQIADGIPLP